jgi:peptide/nickel transport system substrate-binding protein
MTNGQVNTLAQAGLSVKWQNTGNFDMFAITAGPADQVGALADTRVRQAIDYAMPYDQILKNVIYGRGNRDLSIVSPSAPEYTPAWSRYTTDLTKAKGPHEPGGQPEDQHPAVLPAGRRRPDEHRHPHPGEPQEDRHHDHPDPRDPGRPVRRRRRPLQPRQRQQDRPPGVELFNWTAWTDDPKIVIGYWATTGGINNYSLWSSPSVDSANSEFALQTTSGERTAAYQQAQQTIAQAAPMITIVAPGSVTVVAPGITGVSFSPTGSGRFWTLHPEGTTSQIDALFS